DRVLERTETEHANTRFARLEACVLERVAVDDEAAANDEHAEAGGDDRTGMTDTEARSALRPGDLAVGDDVAEVRSDFHPEGDRKPDRIGVAELIQNAMKARSPGNADHGRQREAGAEEHEQRLLRRIALKVRGRSEESLHIHLGVGSVAGRTA